MSNSIKTANDIRVNILDTVSDACTIESLY